MYKLYQVKGLLSKHIVIEHIKNNIKIYHKLEKEVITKISKFDIKKASPISEYYFNENELEVLDSIFDDKEYFSNFVYKRLFFFYNIKNKRVILYYDNNRLVFKKDGALDRYESVNIAGDKIFKYLKKDIENPDIKNKYIDITEFARYFSNNISDNAFIFLNKYSNSMLLDIFVKKYKKELEYKEIFKYEINGPILEIMDSLINLLEVRNIYYNREREKMFIYYKNIVDPTSLTIKEDIFDDIKEKYKEIISKKYMISQEF